MQLRDYQTTFVQDLRAAFAKYRRVIGVKPTGAGKCLAKGTPVMMFDGKVKLVELIQVGDLLMGPDSAPRRVLSLARGREEMFTVTPTKGDSYTVNRSHILSLKMTNGSKKSCGIADGTILDISINDYLRATKTFKHCAKGYRVAVDFPAHPYAAQLDPYFLGMWLGDGNSAGPTITTGDPELKAFCTEYAKALDMTVTEIPNSKNSIQLRFKSGVWDSLRGRGHKTNPLRNALEHYRLVDNKHIPHRFKTASREDRLQLLAGIIDTDGYNAGKGFDLTLANENLLDDVIFVARSLGFAAFKGAISKTCVNNGVVGTYYRCSINGPVETIPCKITRKKAQPRKQIKDVLLTGLSVDSIGDGEYFGFAIDGDGRFLLGDFTVTHNTACFSYIAKGVQAKNKSVLILAHRRELLRQISAACTTWKVPHAILNADSRGMPRAPVIVGSIFTFVNRMAHYPEPDLIIIDECFPAGTLIDGKPIETISVGDDVASVNHATGSVEHRKVTRVFRSSMPEQMIQIRFSSGRLITCTFGHPFFVDGHYIPAISLERGHMVVTHDNDRSKLQELRKSHLHSSWDCKNILLKGVPAGRIQILDRGWSLQEPQAQTSPTDFRDLRGVRHEVRDHRYEPAYEVEHPVLFSTLFRCCTEADAVNPHVSYQPEACGGTHAEEQSNEGFEKQREDACVAPGQESQAADPRRQWRSARDPASCISGGPRLASRGDRAHELQETAVSIPNRHCTHGNENSNRSRWVHSPISEAASQRQKESKILAVDWVEAIKIYQPRSDGRHSEVCGQSQVYNIEVEGNHNYFANGVLVHNCHHAAIGTTWGRVVSKYQNAKILGVTATPIRLDGKGLGDSFDTMVQGPTVAELTAMGWLTPAEVYAPKHALDLRGIKISGGDYSKDQLAAAMDKPSITGDAVEHYLRICPGKQAIAFCCSIQHAEDVAAAFNMAGVKAEHVDGKMEDWERDGVLMRFARHTTKVLTSCDLINEGFDCPSIEVAILLRPTKSLGLYMQQVGRSIRPAPGKDRTIVLDHAGNSVTHGFVDDVRQWQLNTTEKKERIKAPPVSVCPKCYAIHHPAPVCPRCGHEYVTTPREVAQRDGSLEQIRNVDEVVTAMAERDMQKRYDILVNIAKHKNIEHPSQWAFNVLAGDLARKLAKDGREPGEFMINGLTPSERDRLMQIVRGTQNQVEMVL